MWQKQRKKKKHIYSIAKKLRKQKKSNPEFEAMLSNISLEDIIALKLEMTAKYVNGHFFGFPTLSALTKIVREGVLKYVFTASPTHASAAAFLGVCETEYHKLLRECKIKEQLKEQDEHSQ